MNSEMNSEEPSPRVLVAEDDEMMADFLREALEETGYRPTVVGTAEEAESALRGDSYQAVVSDIRMPGNSGLELLDSLRARDPDLPVILITAYGDVDQAVHALRAGASDFLRKPFEAQELVDILEQQIHRSVEPRDKPTKPVYASQVMDRQVRLASQIAPRPEPVLITGESGVGKEVFARYLHYHSPRAEGALLTVNCSAIPRELLESELFGHKKGAYTDASGDREGLFLAADGGSLLLDEIGDMPQSLQAKLLRVIEQKEVKPLGSDRTVSVDVRILAATNQNLEELVENGDFRQDLYFRLNVHRIDLPPLRERREDISELADHFRRELDLSIELSPEVMDEFESFPWPGNVRQLINVLRRLDAVVEGVVHTKHLPAVGISAGTESSSSALSFPPEPNLSTVLKHQKAEYIRRALEETEGNRTRAAELLGMNRTTLVETMKRLDVDPSSFPSE